jgi:hypothetical protein
MYAWRFLTFWMVVLVILHKWTHKHIDLLYMSWVCLIVGSYVSFIGPGVYVYNDVVFKGLERFIVVDVAIHIFFFMFVSFLYYDYYKVFNPSRFFITLLIILSFSTLIINPQKVYKESAIKLYVVLVIATVLYFFI